MNKYIIIDEEGLYWSVSKGNFSDKYGNKRKVMRYWGKDLLRVHKFWFKLTGAILLGFMRHEGIKADLYKINEVHK